MQIDAKALRIEGLYQQKNQLFMLRVKLASGLLSVAQARVLGELGQVFGSGSLHLSTRGSVEFHNLEPTNIPEIQRTLASVGLFSRGACGGAVRGISCHSTGGQGFNYSQQLARRLLLYFSGNPHFEGLPKKFKISVEADSSSHHHLIQDLALVFAGLVEGEPVYDVWVGGGLGRAPQAAILYQPQVPQNRVLQLAEALIKVYAAHVQPPKRLKSLIKDRGEEEFRRLFADALALCPRVEFHDAFDKSLLPGPGGAGQSRFCVSLFAGELPAAQLSQIAQAAERAGLTYLLVDPDQNLVFLARDAQQGEALAKFLAEAGIDRFDPALAHCRVCPGNHECALGLTATRDLARRLLDAFGQKLQERTLAISGCANSCAQPQLADFGIFVSKITRNQGGEHVPLFDVFQFSAHHFAQPAAQQLNEEQLFSWLTEHL